MLVNKYSRETEVCLCVLFFKSDSREVNDVTTNGLGGGIPYEAGGGGGGGGGGVKEEH